MGTWASAPPTTERRPLAASSTTGTAPTAVTAMASLNGSPDSSSVVASAKPVSPCWSRVSSWSSAAETAYTVPSRATASAASSPTVATRLGLVGQAHHRRQADGGVLAGRPQTAGRGVEHRQAAAGHPDRGVAGDGGLLTVRRPHLRGVEGHDDPLGEVDPDDRRAVLDDVEVGVEPGEDGPVELADRLVDAAVGAVAVAGHPDAAVVQLGGVGLVAVGLDGVHDDAAHGHRERDPRRQPRQVRRASALQVTPERHAVSFPLLAPWMPRWMVGSRVTRNKVEPVRGQPALPGSQW